MASIDLDSVVADAPTLDPARLEELQALCPGEPTIVRQVIEAYVLSTEKVASTILDAVSANDLEAAALEAHRIRSSTLQVGGIRLHHLIATLEAAARAGKGDEVLATLRDFEPECAALCRALADMLASRSTLA